MKKELKISRLAIICVLCTAVSGAYGASSVRSLGGSGTYSSASDAAAANSGSAGSTAAVRGGSVRVTPSSGVSGTGTTINAGTTTSGRVATTPRLSIGHYLGGGTSVSGGSSLRPQTPSTGGGSMNPGESGGASGWQDAVDELWDEIDGLYAADTDISDQLQNKQDVLTASDGLITIENGEIFIETDNLAGAIEDKLGTSRQIELGVDGGYVVWRYAGDADWQNLVALDDLRGPQGEAGESVTVEDVINGIEDDLQAAVNTAVSAAVAAEIEKADLVTNTELEKFATDVVERGLQAKANAADVYTKAEVYNKTEVDSKVADIVAGDMDEALANKADKTYVDTELSKKADKTELANYATTASVSALGTEIDDVAQAAGGAAATATAAASDAARALSGLDAKENVSNKQQTVTNSATDYPSGAAVTAALADKADKTELAGYATTDDLDAKADKATTLAGYGITDAYTTTQIDEKLEAVTVGGMEGMEQVLAGKQDVANMAQTVTDDDTKYPSSAAVYGELETKANASDLKTTNETVNQIEQNVTNVTETVNELDETINNAETGLVKQVNEINQNVTNVTQSVTNITEQVTEITNPETGLKSQIDAVATTAESAAQTAQTAQQTAQTAQQTAEQAQQTATGAQSAVEALGATVGNAESGLVKDVADAAAAANDAKTTAGAAQETANTAQETANAAKSAADAATAGLANKQDKLEYTPENQALKTQDIETNAGSTTMYPSAKAVVDYVANAVAEGVDINTDKIQNGAVTMEKLGEDVKAELDAKADADSLGKLAQRDEITNAEVAANAAIEKSKLASDVQAALDKAEKAVSTDGAAGNSVLGTDGDGNPVWYEIAM